MPDAEIYVTSHNRLKDFGRQRLLHDEKLVASRFALWSVDCCARAISSRASVIIVLDPFEAGVGGPHEELFASLKSVKSVFLVPSAIEFFRKNARVGHQARVLSSDMMILPHIFSGASWLGGGSASQRPEKLPGTPSG
jgi:hypothetical protein